jgi:hypothetical protein
MEIHRMKASKARKNELREKMRRLKNQVKQTRIERARVASKNPHIQSEKRRRRIQRLLLAILLLLLLLLIRCDCGSGLEPGRADAGIDAGLLISIPDASIVKPRRPLSALVKPMLRPALEAPDPLAPKWLDAFRLQVAARSARLAQCFDGAQRPGAIRWTSSMNSKTGITSDHEFEAVADADVNLNNQCLIQVLSKPAYGFSGIDITAMPGRVSIVIEF